jgi:hypothetical protein
MYQRYKSINKQSANCQAQPRILQRLFTLLPIQRKTTKTHMSQLMRALRNSHRGPVRYPHSSLTDAEIEQARASPYVLVQRQAITLEIEDGQVRHTPRWYKHYAQPLLVYAYDTESMLSEAIDNMLEHVVALQTHFPRIFPVDIRFVDREQDIHLLRNDNIVPIMSDDNWSFLVFYGVHDLLVRQIPLLPAFERACLLIQAFAYVSRMADELLDVQTWEFGVQFGLAEDNGIPRLKLVRIDNLSHMSPGDTAAETIERCNGLRGLGVRAVTHMRWGFEGNAMMMQAADTDEASSVHVARVLDWARAQNATRLPADSVAHIVHELLVAFEMHPQAAAMQALAQTLLL